MPRASSPLAAAPLVYRVRPGGADLIASVLLAGTSRQRRKGLLGQAPLAEQTGLWIDPCEAIHTFGMRFSIDVAFLDKRCRVVKVCHSVPPRRIRICWRAGSVLELASGTLAAFRMRVGDTLEIRHD